MAIFGPKDADAPMLTQLYQVQVDPAAPVGSELDRWMWYRQFRLAPPKDGLISATPQGEEELRRVAHLHGLVKRCMDAMEARTLPAPEDLEQVIRLARSLHPLLVLQDEHNPDREPDRPLLLHFGEANDQPDMTTAIVSRLVKALDRGYTAFRRCPTCNSVFIAGRRGDQRRCSRRCNDREHARRMRKTRQAEEQCVGL